MRDNQCNNAHGAARATPDASPRSSVAGSTAHNARLSNAQLGNTAPSVGQLAPVAAGCGGQPGLSVAAQPTTSRTVETADDAAKRMRGDGLSISPLRVGDVIQIMHRGGRSHSCTIDAVDGDRVWLHAGGVAYRYMVNRARFASRRMAMWNVDDETLTALRELAACERERRKQLFARNRRPSR